MAALPEFRLHRPATAAAAVALRAGNPGSRFLAGGTDLLPNIRRGLATPDLLIDLSEASELKEFVETAGSLRIGAGVSLATVAGDARVRRLFPGLAQAALAVAGPTHRVAATLGGNLCLDTRCQYYNQSEPWRESIDYCLKLEGDTCRVAPKSARCYAAFSGDVAPALLVLDATVEILGPAGPRRLPIRDFYKDDGMAWLDLGPDELLVAVEVPLAEAWRSAYDKLRIRGAVDFPLVGVAVALKREGGSIAGLRVACTGVSCRPELIDGLEPLMGKSLDDADLAVLDKRLLKCTQPMETTVVSVPYRRRAMPLLARRVLAGLWSDG